MFVRLLFIDTQKVHEGSLLRNIRAFTYQKSKQQVRAIAIAEENSIPSTWDVKLLISPC